MLHLKRGREKKKLLNKIKTILGGGGEVNEQMQPFNLSSRTCVKFVMTDLNYKGEWHGLAVSIDACHSKGWGFEFWLFFFRFISTMLQKRDELIRETKWTDHENVGAASASKAGQINSGDESGPWKRGSGDQTGKIEDEEPAGERGMKNTKRRKMVRTKKPD